MVTSSRNERAGRTTFLLVALMLLQSAPLLTVSASTTPPSSSGDWTIDANEVAYLNSTDQALVQGDVLIHGELHINSGSLFLWGSSDGQRASADCAESASPIISRCACSASAPS